MKQSWMVIVAVVVGIIVVGGLYYVSVYNRLVTMSENIDGQWAQVETQYQRRFDLIPNLVESVKGIMDQEQEVFGALAEARTQYSGANTISDQVAAANQVESALGRLLVVMENYPELRSTETVTNLMTQLEGTENRISVERRRFNDTVRVYNTTIRRFPASVIAGMNGFESQVYFEAVDGSATAPEVSFE